MNKNKVITGLLSIAITAMAVINVNHLLNQNKVERVEYQELVYPTPATQYKADTAIKDQFKDAFMEGCLEKAIYSYCDCSYDYIVNNYGMLAFFEMSDGTMPEQEFNNILVETLAECGGN